MAQVQRRNTDVGDHVRDRHDRQDRQDRQDRRKSGIFSFTRSFKRSGTDTGKGDPASSPTTPPLEPVLKKTSSSHSIPAATQTSEVTAEAERPLGSSPPRPHASSSTEALQRLATGANKPGSEPLENSEGLPTPPDTPGPSTTATATLEDDRDMGNEVSGPDSTVPTSIDESRDPAPPEPARAVLYHEDADLHIRVHETDGTAAVYSVRSSALEGASRVWKKELASRGSRTYLRSPDPAYGLDVIFSIAHYKFHDVPRIPGIGNLYDVAVVAEKFQTIHLLVPFIRGWIAGLPSQITVPGAAVDEDKTLVTGWLLGQAEWFSKILSNCAYNAQVGADGRLLDSEGRPWSDQPVSDDVVDIITATRLAAIENIIKAVSEPVQKLLNPHYYPDEDIRYCHAPEGDAAREDCEQLQLGSAIMGLTKAKLWPPPEPGRIRVSPVQLANAYGDVRIRRHQEPGLRFKEGQPAGDSHARCGFGHREEIENILATPAQLSAGVVRELYLRAKRSGAYSEDLFKDLQHLIKEDFGAAVDDDLRKNAVGYKQATHVTAPEIMDPEVVEDGGPSEEVEARADE